jgi:predicted acyltransferase
MSDQPATNSGKSATGRLLSIDALRGFDMFWIAGGEDIIKAWAAWTSWSGANQVAEQWKHVDWEGFRFYDLIFPLFLFLVGVVLPFSLGKQQERGVPASALYGRIIRRSILLFVLGLMVYGFMQFKFYEFRDGSPHFDFGKQRFVGVLQRIAICYAVAAVIMLNTRVWVQALLTVAILGGYWALLAYVPSPESGMAADYNKMSNLPGYIDKHYLPGKIEKEWYGYGDNEGLLSTVPSVATTLMGVLAGYWLLSNRPQSRKVLGLLFAGAVCLMAGYIWGGGTFWPGWKSIVPEAYQFPIIKNIWTSSYALFAGGWSLLLLGLFYWVIDVLKFRAWAFFFAVIGANAILIYIAKECVDFNKIADFFLGGVIKNSGSFQPVMAAIAVVAVQWVCLWFLYRKKIFLRV